MCLGQRITMSPDKQIRVPECAKCGIKYKKGVPLMYFHDTLVCGTCAMKLTKMANAWIQEVDLDA